MQKNAAAFAIRWLGFIAVTTVVACRPVGWTLASKAHADSPTVPDAPVRPTYSSRPEERGVRGGEGTARLDAAMRKRFAGMALVPDGRLARFAGRVIERVIELRGNLPDLTELDGMAHAFYFETEALAAGVHRFEVYGKGPTGIEIVANVPIVVGDGTRGHSTPESVDETDPAAALLQLMNRSRAQAGLSPLGRAPVLERVAAAHSEDMMRSGFVGHESPVTQHTRDRARTANLRLTMFGENVAYAATAAVAHHMLMESPGHRRNVLHPVFTHVGVGVTRDTSTNPPMLRVTELFASYPAPMSDPVAFSAELLTHMNRARAVAAIPPVSRDRVLDGIAQGLAERFAARRDVPWEGEGELLTAEDHRILDHRRPSRIAMAFPATPSEIAINPNFAMPDTRTVGIGVVQIPPTEDEPRVNVVAVVAEE